MILLFFFFFLSNPIQTHPLCHSKILVQIGRSRSQWFGIDSPSKLDWLASTNPTTQPTATSSVTSSFLLPPLGNLGRAPFLYPSPPLALTTPSESSAGRNPRSTRTSTTRIITPSRVQIICWRFESGRGPKQIHLVLTGQEVEMRVMFTGEDPEERHVRYGEKEGELEGAVAVARTGRYEREDMCHAPANESVGRRDPGWIFDSVMSGL